MVLVEAAAIAGILGNATGMIDKIYGRFIEFKTGKLPPLKLEPAHSAIVKDDPDQGSLILVKDGVEWSKVNYVELGQRLSPREMHHLRVRETVMESLYEQWEAAYPTLALEDNPIRKKRLQQQLAVVANDLGRELADALRFITKCGLMLDDHYEEFRDIVDGVPTRIIGH